MKKKNKKILIGFLFLIIALLEVIAIDYYLFKKSIPEAEINFIASWSSLKPFLVYFTMLLGLFTGRSVEILEKKNSSVKITKILRETISSRNLWIALFVSPIAFYGLWLMVKQIPSGLTMMFVSYQNGFFWEGVSKVRYKPETND